MEICYLLSDHFAATKKGGGLRASPLEKVSTLLSLNQITYGMPRNDLAINAAIVALLVTLVGQNSVAVHPVAHAMSTIF